MFVTFISCKKDKFSTTPSLKFEKVSTTQLRPGQIITFTMSFTYKGALTGNVWVQELVPLCSSNQLDSINTIYPLPEFPSANNQKGEVSVTYGYNVTGYGQISTPQCAPRNDTAVFRFVLKADSSHVSDTVSSPPVIIYYQ